MDNTDFDELAARIDAMGHALLRVVAELEVAQVIDGPRVSQAWRLVATQQHPRDKRQDAVQALLNRMADLLDEARQHRAAPR